MTLKELSRYKHYQLEAETLRQRLKSEIATDTVSGSSPEYPYTKHTITVEGLEQKHQAQLHTAYLRAYSEQIKLEAFIQSVDDPLVREIIRLKFIENKQNGKPYRWDDLPNEIVGYTVDALKKKLYRCLRRMDNGKNT